MLQIYKIRSTPWDQNNLNKTKKDTIEAQQDLIKRKAQPSRKFNNQFLTVENC